MKTSQITAILLTLLISLVVVLYLASTAPPTVLETANSAGENVNSEKPVDTETEDGIHKTNPFTILEEGPHPKAVLEKTVHDFGTMAMGLTGSYDFVVKNDGEAPLKLAKGQVQCKCTVSGLEDDEVPPGGEAAIHLEWTPKAVGPFGQGAVIWTNAPENAKLVIGVEGNMVAEIDVSPANGWLLGTVPSGKATSFHGKIATALYDSFEITSVETSTDKLKLEVKPMTSGELEQRGLKSGYHLLGQYSPPKESGDFRESVTVYTSLENREKFVFNVTGNRIGPVKIIGQGWVAGRQQFNLGRVLSTKGKTQRLTFMIESAEEPFEASDIQVQPAFLNVKMQADKNSENSKRERHTMILEVPVDSPKGIWTSKNPGKLVITTNHPQVREIKINLILTIQ